jgi:alpha-N-arabinofuranosidase
MILGRTSIWNSPACSNTMDTSPRIMPRVRRRMPRTGSSYANGSADTPMGRLRAQNGHPEPYGIKLWALGNEAPNLCSEKYTGGTKLEHYADRFHEYSGGHAKG